ncbi:hypothetical protein HK102_013010, partial [Quaeritorhiza haematococci]
MDSTYYWHPEPHEHEKPAALDMAPPSHAASPGQVHRKPVIYVRESGSGSGSGSGRES